MKILWKFLLLNMLINPAFASTRNTSEPLFTDLEEKVFTSTEVKIQKKQVNLSVENETTISYKLETKSKMRSRGIFYALKSYRKLRTEHKAEYGHFIDSVKNFRNAMDNDLVFGRKVQESLFAQDHKSAFELLAKYFVLKDSDDRLKTQFSCQADMSDSGLTDDWHIVLYGEETLSCEDNRMAGTYRSVRKRVYGPGMYIGSGYSLYICSNPRKELGINTGFTAKAAALIGVKTGLYFGENGVCFELGAGFGAGGATGLALIKPIPNPIHHHH